MDKAKRAEWQKTLHTKLVEFLLGQDSERARELYASSIAVKRSRRNERIKLWALIFLVMALDALFAVMLLRNRQTHSLPTPVAPLISPPSTPPPPVLNRTAQIENTVPNTSYPKSPDGRSGRAFGAERQLQMQRSTKVAEAEKLLASGHMAQAKEIYDELATMEGGRTISLIGYAQIAYQKGDHGEAIERATQAISAKPSGEAYLLRGLAYLRLGDTDSEVDPMSWTENRGS